MSNSTLKTVGDSVGCHCNCEQAKALAELLDKAKDTLELQGRVVKANTTLMNAASKELKALKGL